MRKDLKDAVWSESALTGKVGFKMWADAWDGIKLKITEGAWEKVWEEMDEKRHQR